MKKLSKKEWVAVAVAGIFVAYTLFGGNIMSLFQKEVIIEENNLEAAAGIANIGGVTIKEVVVGTGAEVKAGDQVAIHYLLSLPDGTPVQNSKDSGKPFVFTLGADKVIPGMELGMTGMKVGGVRTITIPPQLAYGNQQVGPIPPNSTLVFTIELLDASSTPQPAQ